MKSQYDDIAAAYLTDMKSAIGSHKFRTRKAMWRYRGNIAPLVYLEFLDYCDGQQVFGPWYALKGALHRAIGISA